MTSISMTFLARWAGFLPTKFRHGKSGLFTACCFFYVWNWFLYYRFYVIESPIISYKRTFWNVTIAERAKLSTSRFAPFPFLTNTHMQTVMCTVFAEFASRYLMRPLEWVSEPFTSFDGNKFNLDYYIPESQLEEDEELSTEAPIIFLLYGIGGTKNDHYIKRLTLASTSRGYRVVVFSYWRLDWMETRDMEMALESVKAKYPMAPICAIACSAGAHVLFPFLADCGRKGKSPFVCAASISGCLDFERTYKFVESNQNRAYRNMLTNAMYRCVKRHHENCIHNTMTEEDLNKVLSIRRANIMYDRHLSTLLKFNGASGMNVFGSNPKFSSPEDTFAYSSKEAYNGAFTDPMNCEYPLKENIHHFATPARTMISDIATTLLMVHAKDDTMVSYADCVDWNEVKENQNIITVTTKRGGHIGFHEWKGFLSGLSWAENMVLDYISSVLEANAQTGFLIDVMSRGLEQEFVDAHSSMDEVRTDDLVPPALHSPTSRWKSLHPSAVASICSSSNITTGTRLVRDGKSKPSFHSILSGEISDDGSHGRKRSGSIGGGI
eukprot:CAMPEP_0118634302 /NCGR_PEP_ID=MMETSP0785-20121206/1468_1 /TAXON_ID=91992 /ORGANISM="Bolidomonas pacifica, Strain CCMP 1866" /LENGTH=551 /DNA_ID=CAMNT_0006525255 /DNA_START=227 /DNA_END=1879 /DNA_ORIENTATION=-